MLSLIVAGITSLPCFGWFLVVLPLVAILSALPLCFLVYQSKNNTSDSEPCNVVITGGSSGIGLAIAHCCCSQPQIKSITLIARNQDKLQAAKQELLEKHSNATIQVISADVTNYTSLQQACQSITMQETTYLFACAGISHPGYFSEIPPQVFEDQMKLNYLGTVYTVKTLLPRMTRGCLSLVSSGAGQIGVFGFTAYSPTKFALRGFAESLHMELSNTPIHIQLAFPNDTNTPGYKEEMQLKPQECHLISENGGVLCEPSDIAEKMVKEAMRKNPPFMVSFGLEGWMLTALTAGMSPISSLGGAITQVTLMGIFRFISLFYLNDFWNIVRKCEREKESNKDKVSSSTEEDKKEQ